MRYRLLFILLVSISAVADEPACPPASGTAVQVLGSGGPIADDGRASSGYLVWVNGRARALVDAGGGTFLRFGEANARFSDLDVVGLSHLHTDHSAALPALLKSGYFSGRKRALPLVGPGPGGPFPGTEAFVASLLTAGTGAYGYLSGYLDGEGRLLRLVVSEFSVDDGDTRYEVELGSESAVEMTALPVPHGIVPALAFRVSAEGRSVVFASDQNGSNPDFSDFAAGADLLVMHLVIPDDADAVAKRLHATPAQIGKVAAASDPDRLVLSHFMARSLRDIDANLASVRAGFDGEIILAEDLACFRL
jgi:ribonuclease BN (tRNA processing enzyme)